MREKARDISHMARLRKRARTVPPDLFDEILEWGVKGLTGTAIKAELDKRGSPDAPSLRTIQEILKDQREGDADDTSGAWGLGDSAPASGAIVLEVLKTVVEVTEGRRNLSRAEAEWIVRIRTVASDLPAWDVYRLARNYLRLQGREEPTAVLDAYLAFHGWRPGEEQWVYMGAIVANWVLEPPDLFFNLKMAGIHAMFHRVVNDSLREGGESGDAWLRAMVESDAVHRAAVAVHLYNTLLAPRDSSEIVGFESLVVFRRALWEERFRSLARGLATAAVETEARYTAARPELERLLTALREQGEGELAAEQEAEFESARREGVARLREILPTPLRRWFDAVFSASRGAAEPTLASREVRDAEAR